MKYLFTILLALSFLIMTQVQVKAQTNYRVNSFYTMRYDGNQFIKRADSVRAYFRGSHSYVDVYGEDLPQYVLAYLSLEMQISASPNDFSKVSFPVDSLIRFGVNSTETAYEDVNSKTTSSVDAQGNIIELLTRKLEGGILENNTNEIYIYNSAGQITECIFQDWEITAWKNSRRELFDYNSAQQMQKFTKQIWSIGSWGSDEELLFEYDAAGNCTQSIFRKLNGSTMDTIDRAQITYNVNNQIVNFVYSKWIAGYWQIEDGSTLTYNSNGDLLELLSQLHVSGLWINHRRATFTYSGTKKSVYLQEKYVYGEWRNDEKTTYYYTASGLIDHTIVQFWNNFSTKWINKSKAVVGYNSQNLISFIYNEQWNLGDYWEKDLSTTQYKFFYESYEGENTGLANLAQEADVNIYPNPTSTILNVAIDWQIPQSSTMTIYDITGRICMLQNLEKAEHTKTQFDVSQLPAGSYYLKIASAKGQISKAFQIVK